MILIRLVCRVCAARLEAELEGVTTLPELHGEIAALRLRMTDEGCAHELDRVASVASVTIVQDMAGAPIQ